MARAKRTDRTEARRRYRAEQAAMDETGAEAAEASESDGGSSRAQARGTAPQRPSITKAFKAAYHPAHVMDDLRNARVAFVNLGFIASLVLTVIGAVWFVAAYNGPVAAVASGDTEGLSKVIQANSLPYFVATMFLQPPPAVGAFLVGFSAKRSSWLAGLVYGIFATIVLVVLVGTPAGRLFTADQPNEAMIVNAAAISPVGSLLFASALAWYRRFLALTSPAPRPRQGQNQRPAAKQQGRGNAPKNVR